MGSYHVPVLAEEAIQLLDIKPDGCYADLTFGGGGHSREILSRLSEKGRLYGFDQDADAQANAPDDSRFTFIRSNFRFMRNQLRARGITEMDGILADLGVSSHHFDTPERGFSFRFDSPLDMRMNRCAELKASDVVNGYTQEKLAGVLRQWGELPDAGRVAGCIVKARDAKPVITVGELTAAVSPCMPKKDGGKFMSKLFQALRIEVNGEAEALKMALEQSLKILKPGGRIVVISYHSIEDRLVKNFFRSGNFDGVAEKDFYGNTYSPLRLLTRKAVIPTAEEIGRNPRSRSAKMRAAEKL